MSQALSNANDPVATSSSRATSVYVHFPWCLQKCPYCDFASATIKRPDVPHQAYADAILRELEWRAREASFGPLESVFFGGGTPSLWAPEELGRVLSAIKAVFASTGAADGGNLDDVEISVECNPSSLDARKAAGLRAAGVNRLSVGVQSLDDSRLKFLGRLHDGNGALSAIRSAMSELPRVSGDLMFGMPGQRAPDFLEELSRLLELGLSHVSAYALTVEPQTQFGELHRKGKLTLAKEDDYAETFLETERWLGERGFAHYEVSNYAQAGQTSRHNQHYWRGGDYLGLGCAAVGCIANRADAGTSRRYRNDPKPERYLARSASAAVEVFEEPLDAQALIREALMLGLRTQEGLNVGALKARTGVDPRQGREKPLAKHLERGNVVLQEERWVVPNERWLHLDSIVADLF